MLRLPDKYYPAKSFILKFKSIEISTVSESKCEMILYPHGKFWLILVTELLHFANYFFPLQILFGIFDPKKDAESTMLHLLCIVFGLW